MQTEWSSDDDDAADAPTVASGVQVPDGGPVAAVDVSADVVASDEQPLGEEELHRSAVDAVDGLLDEVELALTRLDDGTYGRCEGCGDPIDDDRLAELPIVRSCDRCEGADDEGADGDPGPPDPVEAIPV
jgi:RNA polymerase-binding transcription factor DksA